MHAHSFELLQAICRAAGLLLLLLLLLGFPRVDAQRERISINSAWTFQRFESTPDGLSYDLLKPWILPQANAFIVDGTKHTVPNNTTAPGADVAYVQASFDDSQWQQLNLPHDWAVAGPFLAPGISAGMGRLPSNGIGWYRRNLTLTEADLAESRAVFLDVDGAQSHAAVWVNGQLVGGWPYGYASFRLDLTPFLRTGEDNVLAIRLENLKDSSRWYPGAGLYRNVWLVKTSKVHVAQSGTKIRTPVVSTDAATVELAVTVENKQNTTQTVDVVTKVYAVGSDNDDATAVATFSQTSVQVEALSLASINGTTTIANPKLWAVVSTDSSSSSTQSQSLYVAVTTVSSSSSSSSSADQVVLDTYETRFGIRSVEYTSAGLLVNGQRVYVKGTNNHHDLGALGAAFNYRAAQRQLEYLRDLGSNALRMSHNPPAPELLDLADEFGFLVIDEAFDVWNQAKVPNDYHLLFPDWHEADLRAFVRRDANHPSVIVWSIGNEIPEQTTAAGKATGQLLGAIVASEDPTRPFTSALNRATPGQGIADILGVKSLNYQGEGFGTSYAGSYPAFHAAYPSALLWTSESASCLSSRGTYLFPIPANESAVATLTTTASAGVNSTAQSVSAYDLYGPSWGSSADKVFSQQDAYQPFAAGEFVWTGWDYIGEPTPFDSSSSFTARSSYFGIIDLAGFKKDRWYLYQSRWAPSVPSAHILPHWSWPTQRQGQITPVHVFSAADEAELFVNGVSAGRQSRTTSTSQHRFRWDNVTYAPGSLRAVAYKNGAVWAEEEVRTTGEPAALTLTTDRAALHTTSKGGNDDLAFVALAVVDARGDVVPTAANEIRFSLRDDDDDDPTSSSAGEIVATDNGDATDLTVFPSLVRRAFNGHALAIVRATGRPGTITLVARAEGLAEAKVTITVS